MYFKIAAESGTFSKSTEETVVITSKTLELALVQYFQMILQWVFITGDADSEIKLVDIFDFETLKGIEFVKVTLTDNTIASE